MNSRREWFATLPEAKRLAIRELFNVRPRMSAIVLVFVGLWIGTAAIVTHVPWYARLHLYIGMGASLHAIGIFMHEAVHGNLFRHPVVDRWAAFLLGAPVLVPGGAYRVTHLLHHRHTRGEHDPDELANYIRNPRLLSFAFYAWILGGFVIFLTHVPLNGVRLASPRERRIVIAELAVLAVIWGTVVSAAVSLNMVPVLVHGWIIPLGVTFLIVNVRGWSEHLLTVPGDPLMQTRTVISNCVVRFFLLNLNYHLEHHLCPGVPWYNVPRLHELLRDEYREAGVYVYRSYVGFLVDAMRIGVHGLTPAALRDGGSHG